MAPASIVLPGDVISVPDGIGGHSAPSVVTGVVGAFPLIEFVGDTRFRVLFVQVTTNEVFATTFALVPGAPIDLIERNGIRCSSAPVEVLNPVGV